MKKKKKDAETGNGDAQPRERVNEREQVIYIDSDK